MLGTMGSAQPTDTHSHAVSLPDDVLESWATTPGEQLQVMMSPLILAAPGDLISDRDAIRGPLRERLALLHVLDGAGLGETAGYKVAQESPRIGQTQTRFLTLALERGQSFTRDHRSLLSQLQPHIAATLALLDLPLLAHKCIRSQIPEEVNRGYLCVNADGVPVEFNRRASDLANRYATVLGYAPTRGWLSRFAAWIAEPTSVTNPRKLWNDDYTARLTIRSHRLGKESHHLGQDLTLVTLDEDRPIERLLAVAPGLRGRPLEAACHLAFGGCTNQEIAECMGISPKTVSRHLETVYEAAGVNSARELQSKLM